MMSRTKTLSIALIAVASTFAVSAQAKPHPHVKTVLTPLSRTELMGTLRDAHITVFGTMPSKHRLAAAWGQVAFENGQGQLSYNHNLGNITASDPDQPTYFNRPDGHWYRAYDTSLDGAVGYWQTLKHCSAALSQFDRGDPVDAAASLRRCNYYVATLAEYAHGFVPLYYYALGRVFAEEDRERQEQERQLDAAIRAEVGEAVAVRTNAVEATFVTDDDTSCHD